MTTSPSAVLQEADADGNLMVSAAAGLLILREGAAWHAQLVDDDHIQITCYRAGLAAGRSIHPN